MSFVYVAVAAATIVTSVAGTVYASEKTAQAEEYNEKVYEQEAQAAKEKAGYEEELHRERVQRLISSQRAAVGASGVELTGTPLLALEDTASQGELDALAIRYGGDIESARARSAATLSKMSAKSTRRIGYAQAGSSLLSGASSAIGKYGK